MSRVTGLERLAARARAGDRRSRQRLQRAMRPVAARLAAALLDDPRTAARLGRRAVDVALEDTAKPYGDALVGAVRALAAEAGPSCGRGRPGPARSTQEKAELVVAVLCDLEGRTYRQVAEALEMTPDDVAFLHQRARAAMGAEPAGRRSCRGWTLVARLTRLTEPERAAAHRHMGLCTDCRDAHAARVAAARRLRRALPVGGAGVLGVWTAASGPAGGVALPGVPGLGAAIGGVALGAAGGVLALGGVTLPGDAVPSGSVPTVPSVAGTTERPAPPSRGPGGNEPPGDAAAPQEGGAPGGPGASSAPQADGPAAPDGTSSPPPGSGEPIAVPPPDGGVGTTIGAIGEAVGNTVDAVGGAVGDTVDSVGGTVGSTVGGPVGEAVGTTVGTVGEAVTGTTGSAGDTVGSAVGTVGGTVGGLLGQP